MGTTIGPEVEYKCDCDCNLGGCPGHKIREKFHRTSDVMIFEVDGKEVHWFSEPEFNAMIEADRLFIRKCKYGK